MSGTTPDPWALYARSRDQLIGLVRSLTPERAGLVVPITPGWTVTQVVAHVCGLNADIASGRREGLGTNERTAHQVGSRAGRSPEELCQEWLGHEDAMRQAMEENPFLGCRLGADLVVHLHDVEHALGLPIDRDDAATVSAGQTYARVVPERLAGLRPVGLTIELADGTRSGAGQDSGGPQLELRATPYDFLRSATGRRSRGQVQALDWTGDPTPILDDFSPYGPLPSADVPI